MRLMDIIRMGVLDGNTRASISIVIESVRQDHKKWTNTYQNDDNDLFFDESILQMS